MESNIKPLDEIVQDIRKCYNWHLEEIEKLKKALEALGVIIVTVPKPTHSVGHINGIPKDLGSHAKNSFNNIILLILSNGFPMSVGALMAEHKKLTGKDIVRRSFAARLSLAKKAGIVCYEYKERKSGKFWWVLSEWFDGKELRKEYKDKIDLIIKSENERDLFKEVS